MVPLPLCFNLFGLKWKLSVKQIWNKINEIKSYIGNKLNQAITLGVDWLIDSQCFPVLGVQLYLFFKNDFSVCEFAFFYSLILNNILENDKWLAINQQEIVNTVS